MKRTLIRFFGTFVAVFMGILYKNAANAANYEVTIIQAGFIPGYSSTGCSVSSADIKEACTGASDTEVWVKTTGSDTSSNPLVLGDCYCRYYSPASGRVQVFCLDEPTGAATKRGYQALSSAGCSTPTYVTENIANKFMGACASGITAAHYYDNSSVCTGSYNSSDEAASKVANCCKSCPMDGVNVNWNYAGGTTGAGTGNTLSGAAIYGTASGAWGVTGKGGTGVSTCVYNAGSGTIEDTKGYFKEKNGGNFTCHR